MAGKGSKPRPFSVSQDKFAENWERVFGKKPAQSREKEVSAPEVVSESTESPDHQNQTRTQS